MDDLSNASEDPAPGAIQHVALLSAGRPAASSLALAWKAARPELTVTGLGAPDALEAAEAAGAIDRKAASLDAAVAGADLVVLTGRLITALRRLEELASQLEPGTLVTDTGAVKRPITRHAAETLPGGVPFVGGHPVPATRAEAPPPSADAARFDGGTYFLCPPEADGGGEAELRERHPDLCALVEATGAERRVLPAARHDRLAATARDLPAFLSAALTEVASDEGDHAALRALMPPAYRSLVWGREGPSPETREELTGNEGPLLDALGRYVRALQTARRHLAAGDLDAALGLGDGGS
ncbi:MAG: hypothetical protein BRD47_04980 [Bacteroidetes bacterium QS_8_68_28]|nr:MAG: hypothetical protein BRD47_04980 [Bacteroidetes bacterium QS_8_68_28]